MAPLFKISHLQLGCPGLMCRDKLSPLFPAKTWMDMCEKSQQHFCMQGTPDPHPQHSPPWSKHPSPEYFPLSEPARLRRGTAIYTKNETDSQWSSPCLCPRASQLPKNSYEESLRGEKNISQNMIKDSSRVVGIGSIFTFSHNFLSCLGGSLFFFFQRA